MFSLKVQKKILENDILRGEVGKWNSYNMGIFVTKIKYHFTINKSVVK